jgi:chromosome segregation ATPase
MGAEKILNSYLSKLKEETSKTAKEFNELQSQHNEINKLIINTSEECRRSKNELTDYETNKLANKIYTIEQKKDNLEDLRAKKRANEDKKKEKLDNQILEITERINGLNSLVEKIESDTKDKQKEIKQVQVLKEGLSEQNEKSKNYL